MVIKVWRSDKYHPKLVDVDEIWEDTVCWTYKFFLNGKIYPLQFPVLKCQIDYDVAVERGLASGDHADIANRANIYIYESDNKDKDYINGYKYLCKLAGKKPKRYTGVPAGQPPCTKKILDELGTERHLRADIKKRLMDLGYEEGTIRSAFKRLEKTGRIFFSSNNHSLRNCEVWAAK